MTSPRVAASLWSVRPDQLESEAVRLAATGLAVWHWDRADGSLGPAGGFTASQARALAELTGLASEAHLMLDRPLDELDEWLDFCEVVVVHVDAQDVEEAIRRIGNAGRRPALAYSPHTELAKAWPEVDALVMSVVPGHGGSLFRADSLDRIAALTQDRSRVGVDGGVTATRAVDAVAAGASWIVSGTALIADPRPFLAL